MCRRPDDEPEDPDHLFRCTVWLIAGTFLAVFWMAVFSAIYQLINMIGRLL